MPYFQIELLVYARPRFLVFVPRKIYYTRPTMQSIYSSSTYLNLSHSRYLGFTLEVAPHFPGSAER